MLPLCVDLGVLSLRESPIRVATRSGRSRHWTGLRLEAQRNSGLPDAAVVSDLRSGAERKRH